MRRTEQAAGTNEGSSGDRKRVETVVEALATLRSRGESLSEVAHDARNMVTALGLYCDLLDEPGVLAAPYAHYGNELRLVAAASRRLVEKLVELDAHAAPEAAPSALFEVASGWRAVAGAPNAGPDRSPSRTLDRSLDRGLSPNLSPALGLNLGRNVGNSHDRNRRWDLLPALPVSNLAAELLGNRNLLAALAGPSIGLTMDADGCARPVRLTGEDLTRVLVNLVKNAAEAMPAGGRVHIALSELPAAEGSAACMVLKIEDNGPGIPEEAFQKIFASGYTTHGRGHGKDERGNGGWPLSHRGLGLAIARSIVETAGGRISASNREQGGARFEIELPVRETPASSF
jgi:signal transduction histidine kinase